jgi:hypothetical protein
LRQAGEGRSHRDQGHRADSGGDEKVAGVGRIDDGERRVVAGGDLGRAAEAAQQFQSRRFVGDLAGGPRLGLLIQEGAKLESDVGALAARQMPRHVVHIAFDEVVNVHRFPLSRAAGPWSPPGRASWR